MNRAAANHAKFHTLVLVLNDMFNSIKLYIIRISFIFRFNSIEHKI